MTLRGQWTLVAAVVLVAAAALFAATRFLGEELFPVSVGSRAPDFSLRTVSEPTRTRTLADYHGKVILLNIWATWCEPCRVEMPAIEALHREFAGEGLHVLAVSIDRGDQMAAIREFVKEYGLTFEVLHDARGEIQSVYQTRKVPETFVIGRDGVIRKKVIGPRDWNAAGERALVAQLLSEPVP